MQTLRVKASQSEGLQLANGLNSKQRRTLKAIYANPVCSDVVWTDVESLFVALGAIVRPGRGSGVRVALNGVKAVFHEPHPEKEVCKGAVKSVREFLEKGRVASISVSE
ncbi:type II toxin-antitoxin system HicA family toxin [Laspinema palackyanum]